MATKATKCKRMVPDGMGYNDDGERTNVFRVCGAPAVITTERHREVPDGSRGQLVTFTACSVCDAPPPAPEPCENGCGRDASYDGLCYQCQCDLHAAGAYNMDGDGWRF